MVRQLIFCLGLFILAIGGCRPQPLDFEVIERSSQGGMVVADPVFAVLTAEEDFSALYRDLHAGELPPPSPQEVDFSASIVALVAAGEKPSSGYRVEIGEVAGESARMFVEVRFTAPDPGRMTAAVLTRPYVLVRIERKPALETVEFVDPQGKKLAAVPLP